MLLEKRTRANRVWTGAQFANWSDRGMTLSMPTLRDSPLYDAGLDRGDRIVEWDGRAPKTQAELDAILAKHRPGDTIHLRAETRAGRQDVDIVLGETPGFQIVPFELAGRQLTPEMTRFREDWRRRYLDYYSPGSIRDRPCYSELFGRYKKCRHYFISTPN